MRVERKRHHRTLEDLIVTTATMIRPPERLTVGQAAEKYRYLNNPGSYVGYWDNTFAPYLVEPMEVLTSLDYQGMVFAGPVRTGKALPLYTPIPTPTGWTTMGDLAEGDEVFGADGKPCRVEAATGVMRDHRVYRIEFDDGSEIEADAGHKWAVETLNGSRWVRTTEGMLEDYRYVRPNGSSQSKYAVPVAAPLQCPPADLPVPPYTLGVWLGDGAVQSGALCLCAKDADHITSKIQAEGAVCKERKSGKENAREFTARFPGEPAEPLLVRLRQEGFAGVGRAQLKHIPAAYQRASEDQRRQLLRGLMDTDGTVGRQSRSCEFSTSVELLAHDVRELLSGLGIKARVRTKIPKFSYKGEVREGRLAYTVSFVPERGEDVFSLPRHISAVNSCPKKAKPGANKRRWIKTIEKVPTTPVRCIQVSSGDSLFLAGEQMVPTHNSDMAFNWISHTALCDPADMMVVHMTQATARDWSQGDFKKMLRHSKVVGAELLPGKHNQNTHDVRFRNGMRILVKWPTITELSGKTIPRLWLMDYDRMPQDVDKEGTPFDLAARRAVSFRRYGMTVAESSPGFEVEDTKWMQQTPHQAPPCQGILSLYNRGDRRRWYWRCPHCDGAFEPDFDLLQFPDSGDIKEAMEGVFMACPHCFKEDGVLITHDQKHQMNAERARWIKDRMQWNRDGSITGTPLDSDIASFWLKGPAAAFATWPNLVGKYLRGMEEYHSTGSEEALKTTVNTDQGKPYVPLGNRDLRLPEELKARAQDLGEKVVPKGVRFITATVDVQGHSFVVQVHGHMPGDDTVVIDRFTIRRSKRTDHEDETQYLWVNPGAYPEDWHLLLDEVLLRTYPLDDDSGRIMHMKAVACDSGGREGVTANAYEFWRWLRDDPKGRDLHRRFILIKGAERKGAPRVQISYPDSERKDRKAGARGEVPVLLINTDVIKDTMNVRLDRTDPEGGMVLFPDWLDDKFYAELVAEVRTTKGWENPKRRRNESWDLLCYDHALCLSRLVRIEHLDWVDPPGWAAEWDHNDLISAQGSNQKFESQLKEDYNLEDLASTLA